MNAKEYLQQYEKLNKMIRIKQAQIDALLETLDIAGIDYEHERVQSSLSDRTAEIIAKAEDMRSDLQTQIERLFYLQEEICGVIDKIPQAVFRELLTLKYIRLMSWQEISETMHYGVRHLTRLHGYALNEVKKQLEH